MRPMIHQSHKKIYSYAILAGMMVLFTLWAIFMTDLWNNSARYSSVFPKIGFIQSLLESLKGKSFGIQLYLISLGVPVCAFVCFVAMPRAVNEVFPKVRIWNKGYVITSSVLLGMMILLLPSSTMLYRKGAFFEWLFNGTPYVGAKQLTVVYIYMTMVFFLLLIIAWIMTIVVRFLHRTPREKRLEIKREGISIGFCGLLALLISIGSLLLLSVLSNFSKGAAQFVFAFCNKNATHQDAAFISIVCAPIMEEIAFRGVICKGVDKLSHRWLAIIVSSLFFGIWHRNLGQFVYTFSWGLICGYVYLLTDRLRYPMLIHFICNVLAILAYSNQPNMVFGSWPVLNGIRLWLQGLPVVCGILLLPAVIAVIVFVLRYMKKQYLSYHSDLTKD